jgi:hypothetical protein
MTPQERDLTTILLDRVKKTEGEKDPEAVALTRQMTDEQYDAPYYLVQTALIQDLACTMRRVGSLIWRRS